MFEKTVHDMIRGIRANKGAEDVYVAKCMDEIREEIKRSDFDYKTNAVAKLSYVSFGWLTLAAYGWL